VQVQIPNDFTPRSYQERPMRYLDQGGRNLFWVVHRRGGKDLTMLHQECKMAHRRKGMYWHIFPTFAQGRKAIWEGFRKDGKRIMENVFPGFLDPKRPGSIVRRKDEQQMMIELKCGSIWRLLGSDNIEVVGAGPVGVTYSEYAIADPSARNLIRPMLLENGGWEAFITTPRGRNHAKSLYDSAVKDPTWFCELQTIYDTGVFPDPDKVLEEERRAGVPEALVKQEYLCDWSAALVGAVYGELVDEIEKAGGLEHFDHAYTGVFTAWDLGMSDATVIWFYRIEWDEFTGLPEVQVIDHYKAHGKPLSHFFDLIDAKPYRYVKHWLPHDARQTTLSSGVSILNQFINRYGGGTISIVPKLPVLEGIQAGRWLLQQPISFHPCTSEGVEALRSYHYEYDEEKKTFTPNPVHDWSSHDGDAFRYMATAIKNSQIITRPGPTPESQGPLARPLSGAYTLDDLFEDRDRANRFRSRRI
jgi:hypothetical protein